MNQATITPQIASFADAVRQALGDLPADELDELTEGLEADLAEAYAEDLERELPDPVAYAAELRRAAGLPERSTPTSAGARRYLAQWWSGTRQTWSELAVADGAAGKLARLLSDLRPVWWVVRAAVIYGLIALLFGGYITGVLPPSLVWWLVLLGLIAVSIQWGRGRWRFTGSGPVVALVNVTAALLLIPALVAAIDVDSRARDAAEADVLGEENSSDPLTYRGAPVENLFAYDGQGRLLTDVQLFDQQGNAIDVAETMSCESYISCDDFNGWFTRSQVGGPQVLNVYPLIPMMASNKYDAAGNPVYAPGDPRPPFTSVEPVVEVSSTDDAKKDSKEAKKDAAMKNSDRE